MTWHSNFSVISVNLMWIRISTKEFLKSHHTDRQPFVLKFIVSPVKQKRDMYCFSGGVVVSAAAAAA